MLGREGHLSKQPKFVGRHHELETFQSLLDDAESSRAQLVLVEGEQGIGKTRLCQEISARARERGFSISVVQAHELRALHSFDLIARLAAHATKDGPRPTLSWRLPRPLTLLTHTRSGYESKLPEVLAAVCSAVLQKAEVQPSLVICEDIQWADWASLRALDFLARRIEGTKALLIATYRPSDLKPGARLTQTLGELLPLPACIQMTLQGLSQDETAELLLDLCGPVSPEVSRRLHEDTGGNALFIGELARTIGLEPHGLGLLPPISQTVDRIIQGHLSRLPPPARELLGRLSVFGPQISLTETGALSDLRDSDLISALEEALQGGVISEVETEDGEPGYEFVHPLTRRVVYEGLSLARRRSLHHRSARVVQHLYGDEKADDIAYHLGRVYPPIEPAATLHFAAIAAQRAEALLSYPDAAQYWRIALTAALAAKPQNDKVLANLRLKLGRCLRFSGAWSESRELLQQALAYHERLGDAETAARICGEIAEELRYRVELDEANLWLDKTLAICPEGAADIRAWALGIRGGTLTTMGRPREAIRTVRKAARLARRSGSSEVLADVLRWVTLACYAVGRDRAAVRAAEEALAIAEELQDHSYAAHAAATVGRARLGSLDLDGARLLCERAKWHADRSGEVAAEVRAWFLEHLVAASSGEWRQALATCELWSRRAACFGPYQAATANMCLASCCIVLGDAQRARQLTLDAVSNLGPLRALGEAHQALIHIVEGDHDAARACALSSIERLTNDPLKRKTNTIEVVALTVSHLRDRELAQTCYPVLLSRRDQLSLGYAPVALGRARGLVAGVLEEWGESFRQFEDTLMALERAGASYELATTCADYGLQRRRRGRKGDRQRALALDACASEILTNLGLSTSIEARVNSATTVNTKRNGGDNGNHLRLALTQREYEVLDLLGLGLTNSQIALKLVVSPRTVERHVLSVFRKTGAGNRAAAAAFAVRMEQATRGG